MDPDGRPGKRDERSLQHLNISKSWLDANNSGRRARERGLRGRTSSLSRESRDSRFTGNARRAEASGAGGGARASLADADADENKGESETK